MKIAFFSLSYGTVERGAETFIGELSRRLVRMGHQVDIISGRSLHAPRWPLFWRLYLDPSGFQGALFTLKNLPKLLREKYDVIIPIDGGWQPALIRVITWLYGGKMVISGQSGKGWDDRNNLWCFPDAFISLSNFLEMWAKRVNPLVNVRYIPNGVDLGKFKPSGRRILYNLPRPIILCVGALTDEKRIDLTIKAVAKMGRASLIVAGEGPLESQLKTLGKTLLGTRFHLSKYGYEKMPEVYRGADVFTLASPWYRSFEIVIVEALASGLPIVANDDEIRKQIVKDAGLLVDPTNIASYAKALDIALNTRWGNRPRQQAETFSWDKIAKEYEKLFKKL